MSVVNHNEPLRDVVRIAISDRANVVLVNTIIISGNHAICSDYLLASRSPHLWTLLT